LDIYRLKKFFMSFRNLLIDFSCTEVVLDYSFVIAHRDPLLAVGDEADGSHPVFVQFEVEQHRFVAVEFTGHVSAAGHLKHSPFRTVVILLELVLLVDEFGQVYRNAVSKHFFVPLGTLDDVDLAAACNVEGFDDVFVVHRLEQVLFTLQVLTHESRVVSALHQVAIFNPYLFYPFSVVVANYFVFPFECVVFTYGAVPACTE